jgi:tetratricopeptide (TPR) repeat protein
MIDRKIGEHNSKEEVLYVTSGKILKRFSLGNNGILADLYWMRAVQYYGGQRLQGEKRFDLLEPLINIAITLDPYLLHAYRFGAIFLSEREPVGANNPQKAIDLLKKGIDNNPQEWLLYNDLGFVYYWYLRDYTKAAEVFLEGSKKPKAKPWMRTFAAELLARGGSRRAAELLWKEAYETATISQVKENARENLMALAAQDDIDLLQNLTMRVEKQMGKPLSSLQELVRIGALKRYPLDPKGYRYLLNPTTGKVELSPESPIRRID